MALERDQRVRDTVHNLIKFSKDDSGDEVLWKLVQTLPFQRLRRIKQLGFSEFVYPGATHSRFAHSLGAMQMARRMLDVFERNNVIDSTSESHKSWRLATQCASLLHDIGHGPFSHVFEEVSSKLGIKVRHEQYTKQIIESDEIKNILSSTGEHLFENTVSFFTTEPGNNSYSRIVSSQLDADRLDFLVRDRHSTGVRFGMIDLEWLFDSLAIEELPVELGSEAKEFTIVVKVKGQSVIVDYLSAYSQLYSKVYFHKTTRSVQFMVQDILTDAFSKKKYLDQIPDEDLIKQYFSLAPTPQLNLYLALDDSSILNLIKYIAIGNFGELTELARRFLIRDLYKCFEPPKRPKDDIPRQRMQNFITELKKQKLKYHQDLVPAKGYKQYEIMGDNFLNNILVYSPVDSDYKPIVDLSPEVSGLTDKNVFRFYFRDTEDKKKAVNIWDSLP